MKRLVLLMLFALSLIGAEAQKTYVMVTAVSSYQDSRNNVTQTTKNAKSFAKLMKKQTSDVSILTSKYANHDNVLAKLMAICKAARSTDRIIFFFAGHGGVDDMKTGCIYSYDEPILYSELMQCMKESRCKEKIMIIEACHSGSSLSAYIDKGVTCLASSRMDEYSYYHDFVGAGFFSKAVLLGLQGKADYDGNKKITISELYKYAYSYVLGKSNHKQHPQLITSSSAKDIEIFDCTKL